MNLDLTEEERSLYGNRCLQGYKKVGLLGRGGCALVWLGMKDEKKVAIK